MIYIFKVNGFNHYKIGIAKNVKRRFKEVDRYNPLGIVCLKTYETLHDRGIESRIQEHYKDNLIKHEWYEINEDPLEIIDKMMEIHNKPNHRTYVRKKQDKGSMVELARKVIELYDIHLIGQGKRNDIINNIKDKENKVYQRTEFIVANLLNISTSKVQKLKRLYNEHPSLLVDVDNGVISSFSEAYSLKYGRY